MSHLTSPEIDGLAGGLLDADDATKARAHLESCERCRGDLAAAESAMAHFKATILPRTVGTLRRVPAWRRWLPALVVPVLAVAALVLWLGRGKTHVEPDVQIKGDITFQVFAKRGNEILQLRDGTKLRAGDAIRFVAGAQSARYLLIGSIDGAGNATLYYPYGGPRSAEIGKTPGELPGSIVLDASPGPERLFAVFSDEPIEGDAMKRALKTLGTPDSIRSTKSLAMPGAKVQTTIEFEKESP